MNGLASKTEDLRLPCGGSLPRIFHLDKTEAVITETWMPGFCSCATKCVAEPLRAARATLRDGAVWIEQFAGSEL